MTDPYPHCPIAIIGAGCHLPGGPTLPAFQRFVAGGGCAITELPANRYDRSLYYDATKGAYGKSYCWKGAMLDTAGLATPVAPALAPSAAARLHPLQKLALGVAAETFASAGIDPAQLVGQNIPVILGGGRPSVDTLDRAFAYAIERLVAPLDEAMAGDRRAAEVRADVVRVVRERYGGGEEPWPSLLGRQSAGVVARAYGLTGRYAVIDAACASSLAAIASAKRALEQRTVDMALAGSATLFDPYTLVAFAQARSLTNDSSFPFDARASGFIPGEGSGMFLLERLDDALARGRKILGVIRSIGASCDGSGRGTWAPRKEGQVYAIERAYARGHVDPDDVTVIEAHATSTRLGDATEVASLAEVFGRKHRAPLWVGSVKSNVGHTLATAGSAGLVKVLGAFATGTIAPSIGYTTPNPDIKWDRVPLRVVTAPTPWARDGKPRIAAIDSFGIGGLNYHLVVEEPPTATRGEQLMRGAIAPTRGVTVAIVGTGAFVAGAKTSDELAQVVASGTGQFRRVPATRAPLDIYHQADGASRWRTAVEEAAVADDPKPDAARLKIPPKLIANYDPLHFMCVDAALQAFGAIGKPDAVDKKRVAVFVGSSITPDFHIEVTFAVRLAELARLLDEALATHGIDAARRAPIVAAAIDGARRRLPPIAEESSANLGASTLSWRVAKTLDVNGPVFAMDAGGTASSLAAFEAGVESLLAGDCDVAVVGGGDRALRVDRLALWDELAGSPEDRPGEGAAMVVLRRLDDAVAAGDDVLATVVGIGAATQANLARAARVDSDTVERAISRAFEKTDVAPPRVQYAVTDAAGRDWPDLVVLDRRIGDVPSPVPIGSPLPLFGHCDGATGVMSVELALIALRRGVAPAARALGARSGSARAHLRGFAEPMPLAAPAQAVAAVTAAGAYGACYHVLLAAPSAGTAHGRAVLTSTAALEPIVIRAASRAALWAQLQALGVDELAHRPPGDAIGSGGCALALRASTIRESYQVALTALTSPEGASLVTQGVAIADAALPASACVLFPGLGSPYEGMLKSIVAAYPAAARRLAEIDALVVRHAGRTMSDVLEREPKLFGETVEWAQFASLTANLVTFEVAAAYGIAPAFVSGHSFGEYAALVVAGALSLDDAVRAAALRAEAIAKHCRPGAMTSVFATRARLAELLDGLPGFAAASNVNSPDEVVVSGDRDGTAALLERCRRENVQARQLTVPAPFHCELLRPACEPFARGIASIPIHAPKIPVISSVTSQVIADPEQIRRALVEQLVKPVDWIAQIEHAYGRGARRFIETGAGNVLARLTAKIVGKRPAVTVSFDERRKRADKIGGVVAIENALVALRVCEPAVGAVAVAAPAATVAAPAPRVDAPAALFTRDEWQELAAQSNWATFWTSARPSLALFARDLYARSRPAAPSAPPPLAPAATPRPEIKMFDATAMRSARRPPTQPPTIAAASPPPPPTTFASPAPAAPPPSAAGSATTLAEEVGGLLVDLVVTYTGYPRELVRFDQELEADLGIDTVKQVEMLGTLRANLELPADESVTVADLPTLAHLRDYVIAKLGGGVAAPAIAPPAPRVDVAAEVAEMIVELVVKFTGYPRELVRPDQELEADLGIDTVKQVELLGTIRARLDLPVDESITVADLPTVAALRDYVAGRVASRGSGGGAVDANGGAGDHGDGNGADDSGDVEEVSKLVTELVVKFTGYPTELVRFDQELEADLGIDTVKQVELLGTIRARLDLPADESITVADLPTLAHLRDYVVQRLATQRPPGANGRPRARAPRRHGDVSAGDSGDDDGSSPLGERIEIDSLPGVARSARPVLADVVEGSRRYVQRPRAEPLAPAREYRPKRVVVVGAGEVAAEIARAFAARGAAVETLTLEVASSRALPGDADLCLASACERLAIAPGRPLDAILAGVAPLLDAARVERVVAVLRGWLTAVGKQAATLSAVTSLGGLCGAAHVAGTSLEGAGVVGLLRALRHEQPALRIKAIDVDAWAPPAHVAAALVAELDGDSPKLWAGWLRGERRVPHLVATPPQALDAARVAALRAARYVIVTGGARGITAELALRLVELGVTKLHVVGRTAVPADVARWCGLDTETLRRRVFDELSATGGRPPEPVAWQRAIAAIDAALEIDRNLARLTAAGATVDYHAADLGDRDATRALLDAIRAADGPVQAIVHGAGIQRSRAFVSKPVGDFRDTLAPKLGAAAHLMELTADDPVELFACFSSVAGQVGNHGQTDYAMTSSALDALCVAHAAAYPRRRAVSIAWPAWDEVGMAVRGGTREQLERRGRKLMSVAEGGNHFARELLADVDDANVVIAGPSIGDPDGQRPDAATAAALDAVALRASALPLVDAVIAHDAATLDVEHRARATDAYLRDHVLGANAILPAVASLELLAELARLARDDAGAIALEDVRIEAPFKLPLDGRGVVYGRAAADGDALALRLVAPQVDRAGRLLDAHRALVTGRAVAARAPAPPAWREPHVPMSPFRYREQGDELRVRHGASLRALVEIAIGDDGWHAARLRATPARALRERRAGEWLVPAPLLDGCLVACSVALAARGLTGLPRGFGRLDVVAAPRDDESCRLLVHELGGDDRELRFDFAVWGDDGRVLLVVAGYTWRSSGATPARR